MTPKRGLRYRLVLAGVVATAVATIVVAALAMASGDRAAAGRRAARYARALSASQLLERHVVDLETGLRGFVPTGDLLFLAPFASARAVIPQDLAQLRQLSAGQGAQLARLDALSRALSAYVGDYATPALQRRQPMIGSQLDAFTRRGKVLVDGLRARFEAFDRAQTALEQAGQSDWNAKQDHFDLMLAAGALALLVGLLGLLVYVSRVVVVPVRQAIEACMALDPDGRPRGAAVIARDITARREAERAREFALAQLAEAQQIAQIGSWAWNLLTGESEWSDQMYRIFGRDPDRGPIGPTEFPNHIHPDDRAQVGRKYASALRGSAEFAVDFRIVSEDGTERVVHAIGHRDPELADVFRGTMQDVSTVRKTELELAETKHRLELIVENMSGSSLIVYDRDLRFLSCEGPLFAHMDLDPLIGRSLLDFAAEETLEVIVPRLERAFEGETSTAVLDADLDGRTLALHVAPYRLADGRIDGALVHWQDISPLRAAEEALREAEQRFGRAFEDAPIGIALVSPDGHWLRVNAALCEIVGYTAEELLGMRFQDVTHPDDRDKHVDLLDALLAGERPAYQLETRYLHQAGHVVWINLSVSLVRDDAGEPLYLVAQIENITERKRSEQELAEARADIDRFFGISQDGLVIADRAGRLARVNPAFGRMLGYETEELIGRSLIDFVHPDDVLATLAGYEREAAGQAALDVEKRYQRKDGSYRWLRLSAAAFKDGFVYATAHDITERRAMEDELRASREQALAASRAKSEFVANMSHEIRTPLNGVVSMAELLLDTELSTEQREYAKVGVTSAHALMAVIDDILDFSKIEAGKLEIVEEDYELEVMIDELCQIVGVKAHQKQLELACFIDPSLPAVLRGDAMRVRQVLLNLVGNAVKFTAAGEVVVRASRAGNDGDRLRLEVADTGIGIEADRLVDLFQPFSQADASTTRRFGGTGLGLSISKQLAELMDGTIGAQSVPGEGSTFWLELPLQTGRRAHTEPTPHGDLTGLRVLIVDDNQTNRRVLEQQTARMGMIPQSSAGGAEALGLLRAAADAGCPFEVGLIDEAMPEMDGLALARHIKRTPQLRSIRLIMLSSGTPATAAAHEAGLEAILIKPVTQSRLREHLTRVLHTTRGREHAAIGPVSKLEPVVAADGGERGRVLVAEDNEINQIAAMRMLTKLGFQVDIAHHGREAVHLSERVRYAAIFMDCQMPELDGYHATALIREREGEEHHTPIIALTANTISGDRERCLAAGMDEYMPKPLRYEQLTELCARIAGDGSRPEHAGLAVASSPAAAAAAPGLFDPGGVESMVGVDQARSVLTIFLDQLDSSLPDLATAIAGEDRERAHQIAHKLKGSASVIGALALADACQQICAGTLQVASDLQPAHAGMQTAAAATAAVIRAHLGPLAPAA